MSTVENLNKVFLEFCDDVLNVVPAYENAIENARKRVLEKEDTKYYLEYFFHDYLVNFLKISCQNQYFYYLRLILFFLFHVIDYLI